MVKVEGHRLIRAPVQKVFQLISRLEAAPRVTGLWLVADLVERKGNAVTVQYRGYFAGIPVESLQRATLHPPHRIDFRQARGGLKAFQGQYLLKSADGDTEVSLTLEVEAGIPFVSDQAARLVLHAFIERSLEKFKLTAERELVVPRPGRRPAEAPLPAEGLPAAGGVPAAGARPAAEAAPGEPEAAGEEGEAEAPAGPEVMATPAPSVAAPDGQAPPAQRRKRRRRRRRGGRRGRPPGGAQA